MSAVELPGFAVLGDDPASGGRVVIGVFDCREGSVRLDPFPPALRSSVTSMQT